ncbi:MAG: nucleotide exchange factor GrpE, partial [Clostridia bacterium]|nr:nucleotide exchange factor GrpE [Clostridia bacterium]
EPHHITGLEEGKTYTLTEKTAPYGYEIAESVEFTVSTDKETQLIEMKDMPEGQIVEEYKAGYTLEDKVIRYSQVIVNKLKEEN